MIERHLIIIGTFAEEINQDRPDVHQKLKHLRGRHDQRDHAWNRGMGKGGASGGFAPGHMNQQQYRQLIKGLDISVANGSMTQEDADAIRQAAKNPGESVGNQLSKRSEVITVMANRRMNNNAGAQGSLSNVATVASNLTGNSLPNMPMSSRNQNDWDNFLNAMLQGIPTFGSTFDVSTGNFQLSNEVLQKQSGLSIWSPSALAQEAATLVTRGEAVLPASVLHGTTSVEEYDFMGSVSHIDQQSLDLYKQFSANYGISTWSLSDDILKSDEVRKAAEQSEQRTNEQHQIYAELLANFVEYENLYIQSELGPLTTAKQNIDDAVEQLRLTRLSVSRHFDALGGDQASLFGSGITDQQRSDYLNNKPYLKDAGEQLLFLDKQMETLKKAQNFVKSLKSYDDRELRTKTGEILNKGEQNNVLSVGQVRLTPELKAFFDTQMGTAVNPDMQQDVYNPVFQVSDGMRNAALSRGYTVEEIFSDVQQFMYRYVDKRLHPSSLIAFDNSLRVYDPGTYYDPFIDTVVMGESEYLTVGNVVHEIAHAMCQNVSDMNDILDGFFQQRAAQHGGFKKAGSLFWVQDNYPDWYCGLTDNYATQIELLSMGMSMLFTNPVKFAKEQPDYFRLVTTLLSGKWLKKTKSTLKEMIIDRIKML